VRHCLDVIDGYNLRYQRMKEAQTKHTSEHRTVEFRLEDPCCTRMAAPPPRRVPDSELQDVRRPLCDAMYRFLVRCFKEELIDEGLLRRTCDGLGVGVETNDLRN
jgi:hypothetical protein